MIRTVSLTFGCSVLLFIRFSTNLFAARKRARLEHLILYDICISYMVFQKSPSIGVFIIMARNGYCCNEFIDLTRKREKMAGRNEVALQGVYEEF